MKDIKDKMQDLINRQKQRLTKEILECERKLNDTLSYYGVGGPYHRQEDALDRRKKQLDELEDFENQLKMAKKHRFITMFIFSCPSCGGVTMMNRQPFNDWHECPVCRKMIRLDRLPSTRFEIVDTGELWQQQIQRALQEE